MHANTQNVPNLSGVDKYKNDEWRRRDFDEDYIKNTLNEFKTTVIFPICILNLIDSRVAFERIKGSISPFTRKGQLSWIFKKRTEIIEWVNDETIRRD